ncbi:hypothetical protein BGZ46_003598 [Entomortierella lignicola]|nr:hypothetical protein BGZ46_003598 [Entomortierella lignicola]
MTIIPSTTFISVFDIYLLQSQICADLTPRDLRRCCLVSKNFYHSFVPFLYQTITISRKATYNKFTRAESLQALYRNRQHVTQVTCVFAQIWEILLNRQCFNLKVIRSLSLPKRPQNQEVNKLQLPNITKLIHACTELRIVELNHFWFDIQNVQEFCRVIRNHNGLQELKIKYFDYMICTLARLLLWSTLRLDCVYLGVIICDYTKRYLTPEEAQELIDLTGEEDPVFRVRQLDLPSRMFHHEADTLLRYLRRCPNLERLTLPTMQSVRHIEDVASIISGTLSNLRHLDVSIMSEGGFGVAHLISACNSLRSFVGCIKQVSTDHVITALLQHRESLEELYFTEAKGMTSQQIQIILSSFPKLQVFDAMSPYPKIDGGPERRTWEGRGDPIFNPKDMLGDTIPWICHNLRVLKLRFVHEVYRDGVHQGEDVGNEDGLMGVFPRVLYEQIGQMRDLEVLWLGRIERTISITAVDEIPIAHLGLKEPSRRKATVEDVTKGIQELEKLEKLEELELRNLRQYISWTAIRRAKSRSWRGMKKLHYS